MSIAQLLVFIRILLLFLVFDLCVGVIDDYGYSKAKGLKRGQYVEAAGTRLSHMRCGKSGFSII
jgi:hypothetical protein